MELFSDVIPDDLKSRGVPILPSWAYTEAGYLKKKKKHEQNVREIKTSPSGPAHSGAASYGGPWKPQGNQQFESRAVF